MFKGLAQRVEVKIRQQLFVRRGEIAINRARDGLEHLGSQYGGWWLDGAMLDRMGADDFIISCGAGEDITFDLEVQKRTGCNVVIMDPTPRAISHYEQLRDAVAAGRSMVINPAGSCPSDNEGGRCYDTAGVDFERISFEPVAAWNREETLRLWMPLDSCHVSLSVVDYERSHKFIDVPATTVSSIAARYALERIAVVKLDIENAELAVVNDILDRGLRPQQLAVEFDQLNFPNPRTTANLRGLLEKIEGCGYTARFFDGSANFLFTHPGDPAH